MSTCDITGLKLAWGDLATCKSAFATACASGTHPMSNGVVNVAACQAAFSGSCDAYFETLSHSNPACYSAPGSIANGATGCGYDNQCVAGDGCDLTNASDPNPACFKGACKADVPNGSNCQTSSDCDTKNAVQCLPSASNASPPVSDGNPICQTPTYGGAGAVCLAGTNRQCHAAFYCGPNQTCTQKLTAGAACVATDNSCDDRLHLSCIVPNGGSATACTAPMIVPAGSQCGAVAGQPQAQACQGNLYCDTTTTLPTCRAKVAMGGGCVTTSAGECAYGLSCVTSTCETPVLTCN